MLKAEEMLERRKTISYQQKYRADGNGAYNLDILFVYLRRHIAAA